MGIFIFNPLTVLPISHMGSDHALCDLFRVYFTAIESTNEQPTMYNLFRNVSLINIHNIHVLTFTHFLNIKQKQKSCGRVVEKKRNC